MAPRSPVAWCWKYNDELIMFISDVYRHSDAVLALKVLPLLRTDSKRARTCHNDALPITFDIAFQGIHPFTHECLPSLCYSRSKSTLSRAQASHAAMAVCP
jgi:hypothetical protein